MEVSILHGEVCKDRGYCHYLGTCTDTVGKDTETPDKYLTKRTMYNSLFFFFFFFFPIWQRKYVCRVTTGAVCVCRAAPNQDSEGELHRHFSCLPVKTQQMANTGCKCPQDWSMRENGIYFLHFLVSSDSSCHLRYILQKAFHTSGEILRHLRHRSGVQSFCTILNCIFFWIWCFMQHFLVRWDLTQKKSQWRDMA